MMANPATATPARGAAELDKLIRRLLADGYDGFLTIEPHLMAAWREAHGRDDPDVAHELFVTHGRKLMELVERVST